MPLRLDYGRGLVIGEPSFGKGTVQAMINLDDVARNDKLKFGELKLTVAQFFRVNGEATQLRGVKPDIALPTMTDAESFGEASYDNALPWIQVRALDYSPAGNVKSRLPDLLQRHQARVGKDTEFRFLREDIAELNLQRKKKRVSLNEAERRKDRDVQEARLAARDALEPGQKKNKLVRDDGLQAGERDLAKDLADEKADGKAKDVLLNEAARILGDEVDLLKPRAGFAARAPRNAAQLGVQ